MGLGGIMMVSYPTTATGNAFAHGIQVPGLTRFTHSVDLEASGVLDSAFSVSALNIPISSFFLTSHK